jgi:glucosyl-3-phosphoglycerate synthase
MSDFAQTGPISTLQQLAELNLPALERELAQAARETPVGLILPCHAGDLQNPALVRIRDEIRAMPFVREVIVSMNGLDQERYAEACRFFATGAQRTRILWNDHVRVRKALGALGVVAEAGKGMNVWLACGLLASEANCAFLLTQDCDVVSFRRDNIVRLCFAAIHPELQYRFAKLYYSRVSDRLFGRVSRLFLAPFLEALVRVIGHQPLIEFLRSFRYPLAGECVLRCDLAAALQMEPGWGLEVRLLCEAFRHVEPRWIAQVDGGRFYEHRHQALGDAESGLFRMSTEIAQTLFANLIDEGFPVCAQFMDALRESFSREVGEALRRSRHLALINQLQGVEEDQNSAAVLNGAFDAAASEFMTGSVNAGKALPAWNQLLRRDRGGVERLCKALLAVGRTRSSRGSRRIAVRA